MPAVATPIILSECFVFFTPIIVEIPIYGPSSKSEIKGTENSAEIPELYP
jgi:hypothetical protein